MNFLSHLYLSGNDEGIIIGNFIADSVKGQDWKNYSPEVQRGIILHRRIDAFTDTHDVVELSKQRLREQYRKYAPVIVDVFYDHFLSANWNSYSDESLAGFTERIYKLINANEALLPSQSLRFSRYMMQYDILTAYGHLEGIRRVMQGMAARARFVSGMQHAAADLETHYQLFHQEFRLFFPDLQEFVKAEIKKI